jgi:transcriptional regulator with XRE-family HTH domain
MSEMKKTELGLTISRRLRGQMHLCGMTSADLMRKTGMGSGQISNYLNGYGNMRADRLVVLANALDCSTDYILGLTNTPRRK